MPFELMSFLSSLRPALERWPSSGKNGGTVFSCIQVDTIQQKSGSGDLRPEIMSGTAQMPGPVAGRIRASAVADLYQHSHAADVGLSEQEFARILGAIA